MLLSICMMVKNEEKNIERCLKSVKKLLDMVQGELIIVDTGSNDNTIDIASKYTDKIFHHVWNNNFSEMRNISISYAKGDWIFIIDADEELIEYKNIITFLKSKYSSNITGASIYLRNIKNKTGNEYSTELITPRIFKNGIGFKYEGSVHNMPRIKGESLFVDAMLFHYGYILDDLELMNQKFIRTKNLLLTELNINPNNPYYMYQLATTYAMHGDKLEAYLEIVRAFNLISTNENLMKDNLYILSAYAKDALVNEKYEEVIDVCNLGIKIEPEFIDLYYFGATAYARKGLFEHSIPLYLKYLEVLENFNKCKFFYNGSIQHYTLHFREEVYCNLAIIYLQLNNFDKAYEYSINTLMSTEKYSQYYNTVYKTYIFSLVHLGKYTDLKNEFSENKFESTLITYIEDCIPLIDNSKLSILSEMLSDINNYYGAIWKLRMNCGQEYNKEELFYNLLKCFELGIEDSLYYMIRYKMDLTSLVNNELEMMRLLGSMNEHKIDTREIIVDYLYSCTGDSFADLNIIRIFRKYLMIIELPNNDNFMYVDDYISSGFKCIESKYNINYLKNGYINSFSNSEEQFLVSIWNIINFRNNQLLEISLNIFPDWKHSVARWLEKKLLDESNNNEMLNLMNDLKNNIYILVKNNDTQNAKLLIDEYLKYNPQDKDIQKLKNKMSE